MKSFQDPTTYANMLIPFANAEKANQAIDAFWAELQELRKKYQITDVHVVLSIPVQYDEHAGEALWQAHLGSSLKAEPMLAYALGREQAEHRAMIAKMLSGKP